MGEGEPRSSVVTAEAWSCRTEELMDGVTRIHSGTEDGVVAKGNVDSTEVELAEVENDVDDGTESSADLSAFTKEKRRTIVAEFDATMTNSAEEPGALLSCGQRLLLKTEPNPWRTVKKDDREGGPRTVWWFQAEDGNTPLKAIPEPSLKGLALAETSRGFGVHSLAISSGLQETEGLIPATPAIPANGSRERTGKCLRYARVNANARVGCRLACLITKLEGSLPKGCKRSSFSSCRCGLLYVCTTAGDGILALIAVSTWGTFMLHVSGWDMATLDWVHDI
ncbi:hypothetical protein PIB30_040909 [Stylosanthes scabra]|uniref:Uncharacterized protein n=1 Tax=Stylosanthes scabra TaxID=79078 RepID=A0ABU6WDB0_9FABA|nr:hypothetical protein [Stylosanthes scabra]